MSGDHGYDPFGLAEPNPAMEAAVAEIDELQAELARLREECESLRAALRPFAQQHFHKSYPDGHKIGGFTLRVEDFRRAAAALKDVPCP